MLENDQILMFSGRKEFIKENFELSMKRTSHTRYLNMLSGYDKYETLLKEEIIYRHRKDKKVQKLILFHVISFQKIKVTSPGKNYSLTCAGITRQQFKGDKINLDPSLMVYNRVNLRYITKLNVCKTSFSKCQLKQGTRSVN